MDIDHEAPDWLVGLRQASVQLGPDILQLVRELRLLEMVTRRS